MIYRREGAPKMLGLLIFNVATFLKDTLKLVNNDGQSMQCSGFSS